jgi:opacity protein-like surface antigen
MKKLLLIFLILLIYTAKTYSSGQNDGILSFLNEAKFGFYLDTYYSYDFGTNQVAADNKRILAATNIFNGEFRINLITLKMDYKKEDYRISFATQYGDEPFLLSSLEKYFIKFVKYANFGVRIGDGMWLDFGYHNSPIGCESSTPYNNYLTSISIGGYCQPGNMLGVVFNWQFAENLNLLLIAGNSYSLVSDNNTNKSVGAGLSYNPSENLTIGYNAEAGDEGLNGQTSHFQLYNNFYVITELFDALELMGQFDFAFQENSKGLKMDETALMSSGMLAARLNFSKQFSFSCRAEYCDDPDGFISQGADGSGNHLNTQGIAAGVQYKPFDNIYFRFEYQYLKSDQKLFWENKDFRQNVTFNAGIVL